MFHAFEEYRRLVDGKSRVERIVLVAGSPILFPLFAIGMGVFFLFSMFCLGILERRQIIGAIKDSFGRYDAEGEAAELIVEALANSGSTALTYAQLRELTSLSDTAVRENVRALEMAGRVSASQDGYSCSLHQQSLRTASSHSSKVQHATSPLHSV